MTCQVVNPPSKQAPEIRGSRKENSTWVFWEADFIKVRPRRAGYKYLLVLMDTFSGWLKAFLTRQETVQVVTKKLWMRLYLSSGCKQPLAQIIAQNLCFRLYRECLN